MDPVQLRPYSFGEILDGAFALYRRHLLVVVLTGLVLVTPLSLVTGFASVGMSTAAQPDGSFSAAGMSSLLLLGVALLGLVVAWGALTRQFSQAVTGGEVSFGDGVGTGLRSFLPLVGAGVVAWFALAAGVIVLAIGLMLVLGAAFAAAGSAISVGVGGTVAGLVGGIATALLMLAFGAMFFAIIPAVVVERCGPFAALRRSWALARGAPFRVIGIVIVAALITTLPAIGIAALVGVGTGMWDPAAAAGLSTWQLVLQQLLSGVTAAFTTPYLVAALVLLYYDRRVRTDGYDLELDVQNLAAAS